MSRLSSSTSIITSVRRGAVSIITSFRCCIATNIASVRYCIATIITSMRCCIATIIDFRAVLHCNDHRFPRGAVLQRSSLSCGAVLQRSSLPCGAALQRSSISARCCTKGRNDGHGTPKGECRARPTGLLCCEHIQSSLSFLLFFLCIAVGSWPRCSRLESLVARAGLVRATAQRSTLARSSWARQ